MTLTEKIISLKRTKGCISNIYSFEFTKNVSEVFISENAVAASYDDHGITRLVFCAADEKELSELILQIKGKDLTVEIVTRDPKDMEELLKSCNFEILAELRRLSTADCSKQLDNIRKYFDTSIGYFPKKAETQEINQFLWNTFDTRISHLLSDDEIAEIIDKGWITIHRDTYGVIDALLQVEIQPKKFYINQIINNGERKTIHAMLQNRLKQYADGGGKYACSWVETDNIASNKFHGKYGFKHDGLYNIVYTKRT